MKNVAREIAKSLYI